MAKIMKEFFLRIWDDGRTELTEIEKKDLNNLLDECSGRMNQTLLIILEMKTKRIEKKKEGREIDYSDLYNEALNRIAYSLDISRNSVRDKLERQLSKTASEIRKLIEDYLEFGCQDLKQVLLVSVEGTQRERQDRIAIEELFK